tara:strand:- start:65 stop:619 length:555 start_codon:yes stop_codon:yes gene_type:complete
LAESALLSALVDLVDWKSWKCETSLKTLQYETCLSKGAIAKKLKVLEDKGLIKRKRQGDERGHTRSAYTIQIDNLKQFLTPVLPLSPQETTLSSQETTLVASGDYPLSPQETPILPRYSTKNSNLDNLPSNSSKDNARGASNDGDDWEYVKWEDIPIDLPMPKTRWEDHGVHVPTQEEMMRKYK